MCIRDSYYLRKREKYCHSEIYSDVEPDPDVETIMRGVQAMRQFQPDVIIALGGGSAMDAAKGMWLFYEHPEATFDGLKLKFMDSRKRAYKFPRLGAVSYTHLLLVCKGTFPHLIFLNLFRFLSEMFQKGLS